MKTSKIYAIYIGYKKVLAFIKELWPVIAIAIVIILLIYIRRIL